MKGMRRPNTAQPNIAKGLCPCKPVDRMRKVGRESLTMQGFRGSVHEGHEEAQLRDVCSDGALDGAEGIDAEGAAHLPEAQLQQEVQDGAKRCPCTAQRNPVSWGSLHTLRCSCTVQHSSELLSTAECE